MISLILFSICVILSILSIFSFYLSIKENIKNLNSDIFFKISLMFILWSIFLLQVTFR